MDLQTITGVKGLEVVTWSDLHRVVDMVEGWKGNLLLQKKFE